MDEYWSNPLNVAHHVRGAMGKDPVRGYPPYTGKEARIQVPGWTGISFDGADLADEDVFRMAKLIDMPNLERLSLRNNPRLTEACRPFVAELAARCPKLRAERVRWPEQLSSGGVVGER